MGIALGLQFRWTDDAVETVARLAAEGKSAGQIAEVLGVTRNTVMGKAHRAGIKLQGPHYSGVGIIRVPKPARAPRARREIAPKSFAGALAVSPRAIVCVEIPLVGRLGVGDAHAALRSNDCRWPIGKVEADDFHFCSRPARLGLPYCDDHTAKAKRER